MVLPTMKHNHSHVGINILLSEHLALATSTVTNTSTTDYTYHQSHHLQAWQIDLTIIRIVDPLLSGDVWTELGDGVTITAMVVVEVVVVVVEGEVVEEVVVVVEDTETMEEEGLTWVQLVT